MGAEEDLLAHALVVPLAAEQAVDNHNRVALGLPLVIVQVVCKVDDSQGRRRMEGARPGRQGRCIAELYPRRMLWVQGTQRLQASLYRSHGGCYCLSRSAVSDLFSWRLML
jgi:hypothetical protein